MNKGDIINGQIASTTLGYEDHGILTFFLHVKWEGGDCGFGGYVLGGEFAAKSIKAVLSVVGVEKWEDLKGKYVRVESNGWGGNPGIKRLGNILANKWLDLKELAEECK